MLQYACNQSMDCHMDNSKGAGFSILREKLFVSSITNMPVHTVS